jgi:pyrimidine-nucleoside phosphorylase
MRAYDIIRKKRDGEALTEAELGFILDGYLKGTIPEYQISSFLMAIYFQGMDDGEVAWMTKLMLNSGVVIDLSDIKGRKVDKHSTGGVGDKISLVLAPLVAAAGVKVPMISGRGLGCTGGTLDKLESIPGYKTSISINEFKKIVKDVGCAIIGTTGEFVPLDRKLYALRDVTATVETINLIAPSIMSKKLAEGIDGLILDVRSGCGGNVKNDKDAMKLAKIMVAIGKKMGKDVVAIISDMSQPTGNFVGNALEMYESVRCLEGKGPADLDALVLEEGAHMLKLAGLTKSIDDGKLRLERHLKDGSALAKLAQMVGAQGGDVNYIRDPEKLLKARNKKEIYSPKAGFVSGLHAEKVGLASIVLGAGRESINSVIDRAVGIELKKKVGDEVKKGEALAVIHYNGDAKLGDAEAMLKDAYKFSSKKTRPPKLIRVTLR